MTIRAAHSSTTDPMGAARQVALDLEGLSPVLVLYFASSSYDPDAIAAAMAEAFGSGVTTVGCTTAGELTQGKMLDGALAVMGLGADALRARHVALVEQPGSEQSVQAALSELARAAGEAGGPAALEPTRYAGLVLHDGMSGTEESAMSALSSFTNVPFIGGSAGDDLRFESTRVFVDGKAYSGAAVLVLLEPSKPYEILKTQSFDVMESRLTVTRVDEATRTVHEFDEKPAVAAYAEALGVPPEALAGEFMRHPLGLLLESGEPYVRSPREIQGASIAFYCHVKEGMELAVLRSRDIVEDTRRDLQAKLAAMGDCRGVVNFHCILRTLELKDKNQSAAYGSVFSDVPTVGFSTYGESYIGHINQTSTMLLLR